MIITSGGSEADNPAIKGVAAALREKGRHIITSSVEHHAVLDSCKYLEKQGFDVTYLPVDANGRVQVEDVQNALRDETILVTIMHANNEVGTIQPIKEISEVVKARSKALFHTDAVQTVGAIPVHLDELGVDLLSLSAHKFYGPKGVGALIIRKGVRLESLIHGGAQERNRRAGTENLPGVVGMAKALELANAELPEARPRITRLRDHLIQSVLNGFDHVRLNGHPTGGCRAMPISALNILRRIVAVELGSAGYRRLQRLSLHLRSLDLPCLLAMGLCHTTAHGSSAFPWAKGPPRRKWRRSWCCRGSSRNCAPCPRCMIMCERSVDMYSDKVMDHFRNPGMWGDPDADGVGEVGNAVCGDIMRIYLKVNDNRIEDIKFKTFGCGAAIATLGMVTEMVKGRPWEKPWP